MQQVHHKLKINKQRNSQEPPENNLKRTIIRNNTRNQSDIEAILWARCIDKWTSSCGKKNAHHNKRTYAKLLDLRRCASFTREFRGEIPNYHRDWPAEICETREFRLKVELSELQHRRKQLAKHSIATAANPWK